MSLHPVKDVVVLSPVNFVKLVSRVFLRDDSGLHIVDRKSRIDLHREHVDGEHKSLFVYGSEHSDDGGLDEWEEADRALFENWGISGFAHSIEANDLDLAREVLSKLHARTDFAIDNNHGTLMRAADFLSAGTDWQDEILTGSERFTPDPIPRAPS